MAAILSVEDIATITNVTRGKLASITLPAFDVGAVANVTDEWDTLITQYRATHEGNCPVSLLDLTTDAKAEGSGKVRNSMHAAIVRAAQKANGETSKFQRMVVVLKATEATKDSPAVPERKVVGLKRTA